MYQEATKSGHRKQQYQPNPSHPKHTFFAFWDKWDPLSGLYNMVVLQGCFAGIDKVDNWERAKQALQDRFPRDDVIIGTSLFARRTWPKDPKDLTTDHRLRCLPQLRKVIANFPKFSEKQFVKAACALNVNIPPLVSRLGRVRAQDCTQCWQSAHQEQGT